MTRNQVRYHDHVYIAAGPDGLVKIGISRNPKQRVVDLTKIERSPVVLLAHAPGEGDHEIAVHAKFVSTRVRGEWFSRSPELTEFTERLKAEGTALLESVRADAERRLGEQSFMWRQTYAPDDASNLVNRIYAALVEPMRITQIEAAVGAGNTAVRGALHVLLWRGRVVGTAPSLHHMRVVYTRAPQPVSTFGLHAVGL